MELYKLQDHVYIIYVGYICIWEKSRITTINYLKIFCCSFSVMSDSLWPHELQHSRLPGPLPWPWSLLKPMSIELVMPSNHLILCHPLLLLPSIFPSIRVFSNESVLCIRWIKNWSFQLQHQSFQWIFRVNFLWDWLVWSPCYPRDSQESSLSQFESINSSALRPL